MAALISSVMDTKDKVPFFVAQTEQMGIEILPPDVNLSDHEFVVVDGNIRFGLDAVKGVGYAAVEAIKRARGDYEDRSRPSPHHPFTSLFDFCARVDNRAVNKKAIEALIKCGAFGSTGASRKGMLLMLEQAQAAGQKAQQDALIGQGSIFDLVPADPPSGDLDDASTGAAPSAPEHAPIPAGEFERGELLALEKESIGLFISAHPLKEVGPALRTASDCTLAELSTRKDGDWVTVGGMITQAKRIKTKKGDWMMFATLDDLEGTVEMVIFGKALDAAGDAVAPDSIVLVRGRVDHKDREKTSLVAQQIDKFEPTEEEVRHAEEELAKPQVTASALRLALDATSLPARILGDLRDVLAGFPGESDVVIELTTSVGRRRLRLGQDFRVSRCAGLHAELAQLLGHAIVSPSGSGSLAAGDEPDDELADDEPARRAAVGAVSAAG
jgi:DNA polymerase-3 subunit alpha